MIRDPMGIGQYKIPIDPLMKLMMLTYLTEAEAIARLRAQGVDLATHPVVLGELPASHQQLAVVRSSNWNFSFARSRHSLAERNTEHQIAFWSNRHGKH